ncbi:MAG TPA: hypothetical protein P5232_02185 [Candidatus Moranbacteria bacterium]|nr:hypothetical protein [Candidatus Moranbacteria bacterium]
MNNKPLLLNIKECPSELDFLHSFAKHHPINATIRVKNSINTAVLQFYVTQIETIFYPGDTWEIKGHFLEWKFLYKEDKKTNYYYHLSGKFVGTYKPSTRSGEIKVLDYKKSIEKKPRYILITGC